MSTDKPIPERWRKKFIEGEGLSNEQQEALIRELGTAESLIRELTADMQKVEELTAHVGGPDDCLNCIAKKGMSRIPAHLRAPETTSTGESSTVLRQEELR